MAVYISQIIPTIQGEGKHIGRPCILIRFVGCNLNCPFCDSKWTNDLKEFKKTINIKNTEPPFKIDSEYSLNVVIEYIKLILNKYKIDTLMFTGGEPTLYNNIISKIVYKMEQCCIKNIEIETNGINDPDIIVEDILDNYKYFNLNKSINISPKLDPVCYKQKIEFEQIIELYKYTFKSMFDYSLSDDVDIICKIVHDHTDEDKILNLLNTIREFILLDSIYIMPLTPDRQNFESESEFFNTFKKQCKKTVEFCLKYGFHYSPRTHLYIFGDDKFEKLD